MYDRITDELLRRLADEAAKVFRDYCKTHGKRPDMKSCIILVIRRHRIDQISEEIARQYLQAIASILGKRGQQKLQRMRREGLLPVMPGRKASPKPRRFSENLPFRLHPPRIRPGRTSA